MAINIKNMIDDHRKIMLTLLYLLLRIQESGLPYVLCTNESCYSTAILAQKLNEIGFNVQADQILSPVSAIIQVSNPPSGLLYSILGLLYPTFKSITSQFIALI